VAALPGKRGGGGEGGRRSGAASACLHGARLCVAAERAQAAAASLACAHVCTARGAQVVDELFSYWTLEESEDTLEALEEALIVRPAPRPAPTRPPTLASPPRRAPPAL